MHRSIPAALGHDVVLVLHITVLCNHCTIEGETRTKEDLKSIKGVFAMHDTCWLPKI